ncbi:MAG TPA: four helix bundle protein [Tepidisphaeraceae bacterium]|jgi:four helix bundle protein
MAKTINDFRDLIVWQRAMQLAKSVYQLTRKFPPDERFGLTNQIRRASVSISSNIAEGHARTGREFRSFLSIARGSAAEVQSQLLLAVALGFVEQADVEHMLGYCNEIRQMTAAIIKRLTTS